MFGWSKWKDILIFDFDGSCLLQGSKNKNGKTRFRVVAMQSCSKVQRPCGVKKEDLIVANLWEETK